MQTKVRFFNVEYDWKPYVCNHYGMFGHSLTRCKLSQEMKMRYVENKPQKFKRKTIKKLLMNKDLLRSNLEGI